MSDGWRPVPADVARLRSLTVEDVEAAICDKEPSWYQDRHDWAHDCHSVSVAIVRSDLFTQARVARGACRGVLGQHSWVTLGDCYDGNAPILDCTLWSYDETKPTLWKGALRDGLHAPHGAGSIYDYGRPASAGGEPIDLAVEVSAEARAFLRDLGPLDVRGWLTLLHAPMRGWPSREIIAAAYQTDVLRPLIPIDLVGMLTDLNPGGLYLKETSNA